MGENEQGGMLRTVVIIGIIAMVALIVTLGVVGLKNSMNKNTDRAVGAVVTTPIPFGASDKEVPYNVYGVSDQVNSFWGNHLDYFPQIGSIPNNSWREVHIKIRSDKRIWFKIDVNNSGSTLIKAGAGSAAAGGIQNDNDVTAKRTMHLYKDGDAVATTSRYGDLASPTYIEANTDYTIVVKYLNKSGFTFVEPNPLPTGTNPSIYYSGLFTGNDDGSQYKLTIKSFEAATYDDKYNK